MSIWKCVLFEEREREEESRERERAAAMATQSDVVSGCYERFVLGHEAVAIKGEPGGKKSDEKSQETDLDATDEKKAFFWTQRFAVKAHQGPVKCIKVSVCHKLLKEKRRETEREELSFSIFGVSLPAHRRVYSTVLSVTSIVPRCFPTYLVFGILTGRFVVRFVLSSPRGVWSLRGETTTA